MEKTKHKCWKYIIYYLFVPVAFYLFLLSVSLFLDICKLGNDLGIVIFVTYAFLFVATPVFTFLIMRLSVLPWIVDPFAALEIPLALYAAMIINIYGRTGSFTKAIIKNHLSLIDDGGLGYFFLLAMFIFGLLCSISFRRIKGDNLPERILRRIKALILKKSQSEVV